MLGKFSEKVKGFGRGVWGLMVVIFSIGFALTVNLSSIMIVLAESMFIRLKLALICNVFFPCF